FASIAPGAVARRRAARTPTALPWATALLARRQLTLALMDRANEPYDHHREQAGRLRAQLDQALALRFGCSPDRIEGQPGLRVATARRGLRENFFRSGEEGGPPPGFSTGKCRGGGANPSAPRLATLTRANLPPCGPRQVKSGARHDFA